ncbi:MAG: divergent polysaccharide deacetylase family protein [Shimia sp.]
MLRGIVFGVVWGLATGGAILAVLSLLAPGAGQRAQRPAPPVVIEVPAGSGFAQAGEDRQARVPRVEEVPQPVFVAPEVVAPELPDGGALGAEITAPAPVPELGGVQPLPAPPRGAANPGVDVAIEAPIAPEPPADDPVTVPATDAAQQPQAAPAPAEQAEVPAPAPDVQTAVEDVTQPVLGDGATSAGPTAAPDEDAPAATAPRASVAPDPVEEAPDVQTVVVDVITPPSAPATGAEGAGTAAVSVPATTEAAPQVAFEAPAALVAEPGGDADVRAEEGAERPAEEAPEADAPDVQTIVVEIETPDASAPAPAVAPSVPASNPPESGPVATAEAPAPPRASAGGFGNRADGVQTGRLPTVTGAPVPQLEETTVATGAPLVANAAREAWAGPDERPLFSIVLIDAAGDAAALGALSTLDVPLTFAGPGGTPAARAAAEAYRAAGHEVAILADLPEGLTPQDVEVAMQGFLRTVPQAVAVLDGTGTGFRGDRRIAGQVATILGESGHGLVTYQQGLGTALQLARQEGVPVRTVYRDLDAAGQGADVIRRFLDQAAFRADQEGGVVLVGRMRAETISALLIWAQQDRAERVNFAPLSALLLDGGG